MMGVQGLREELEKRKTPVWEKMGTSTETEDVISRAQELQYQNGLLQEECELEKFEQVAFN